MAGEIVNLNSTDLRSRFDPTDRIPDYCELLRHENKRINLVSRETSDDDLERLALDSLAPLAFLEDMEIGSYLDIGSGGGLPAIPLLLSARIQTPPEKRPVLIERAQKKAAALRRIAIALGLKIEPIGCDLSQATFSHPFDLITMRFVKLTPPLLAGILPLLSDAGRFTYYSDTTVAFERDHFVSHVTNYMIDNEEPVRTLSIFSRR